MFNLTLLNPWVLLGLLITLLGSNGFSYYEGHKLGVASQVAVEQSAAFKQQHTTIVYQQAQAQVNNNAAGNNANQQAGNQVVYKTIHDSVDHYIEPTMDSFVPCGLVRLHDAAASGGADTSTICPGQPNDAASDVKMSAFGEMLVDNYGAFNTNAIQLKNLEDWLDATIKNSVDAHNNLSALTPNITLPMTDETPTVET